MTKATAKAISDLMVEIGTRLTESLGTVQDAESTEDIEKYQTAVSRILTCMLTEIMNPLYLEHPDIKPSELEQADSEQ
jgi:hypothetical protein